MSQDWQALVGSDNLKSSRTLIQNMLDFLKSMASGTALIATNLVAHMMAHETTTDTVNKRNAANSAWVVMGYGEERFWGLDKYAAKPSAVTIDTEGDTAANTIRASIGIEDRGGTDLDGVRHVVEVWIAATEYAVPSATGNTVAFNAGDIVETVTANAHYRVLRPASGVIELDLTVSGVATRFIHVALPGAPVQTVELTYA